MGSAEGRGPGERGSVLLLVPAAVLVLMILGAIAVDFAIAFLGQRELSGLAAAAANDAATAAISEQRFYRGTSGAGADAGDIVIDQAAAQRLAQEAVSQRAPRGVRDIVVRVFATGSQVCVALRGNVEYVFAKAVPGASRSATVRGTAVATAVEGDAGTTAAAAPGQDCAVD